MAAVVSYDNLQKATVSILQASLTAYGSGTTGDAPDGSNAQFPSSEEINDALLEIDGEVATLICNTLQHPFQTTFVQTSGNLASGASLPARNGMLLKVTGYNGVAQVAGPTYDYTDNEVDATAHGFTTGQAVTLTLLTGNGGTLPNELTFGTTYYVIYRTANSFSLATTAYNAQNDIEIDFTLDDAETGTQAYVPVFIEQYKGRNADEIKEAIQFPALFNQSDPANSVVPWFFVEGDIIYSTALYSKVVYTDYTKTSSPQSPEPYFWAIVSGAVARLAKDGFDQDVVQYYGNLYTQYQQQIASMARTVPAFVEYQGTGVPS
jgi:hypothetical protein